jgi:hypothetical protein
MSLNCGHLHECCSLPGDKLVWGTILEWYRQGDTPDSSTKSLWHSYPQSSSGKAHWTGEGNYEFCLTKYFFNTSKVSLTCREILRVGAKVFTSLPKEVVLRIFVTLEIHSPRLGLNQRSLVPIVSMLINRPLRTTTDVRTHRPDDIGYRHFWNLDQDLLQYTAQRSRRQSSATRDLVGSHNERRKICRLFESRSKERKCAW